MIFLVLYWLVPLASMAQCSKVREVCGGSNNPKLCRIQLMTSSLYRSSGCSSMYFFIYQQEI